MRSWRVAPYLAIVAVMLTLSGCFGTGGTTSAGSGSQEGVRSSVSGSSPGAEVPWPSSGFGSVGDPGAGCLAISVPPGDEAYYVKLKRGGYTVWDVFMRPGSSLEFGVPLGTYDLIYGAGTEWFGWSAAFGPDGAYSEASETFTFDADSCWEVELILQYGGNLGRSPVNYSKF